MRKLTGYLVSLALIFTTMPTFNIRAEQIITETKKIEGSDYTASDKLANKLDDVFEGKIGLYSGGTEVKVPVGSSKLTEPRMYSVKDITSGEITAGWQCYIYANAVYNTLFNECVGHGDSLTHSKKVLTNGGGSLSYSELKNAGVRTGAYMRVASSYGNGYMDNNGHSIIILSYDKEGISYLEGNADNHGLVCAVDATWDEFNYKILSRLSRKVCYIIQPTDSYYDSLYYTPSKVLLSKINKPKNTQVKLSWKKISNVNGYQIKYSTNKKFAKNTSTKKATSTAKSKTITRLERGATYYFKMRAYNTTETSNVYGKWSSVRKVTISEKKEVNTKNSNITEQTSEVTTSLPTVEETTVSSSSLPVIEETTVSNSNSQNTECTTIDATSQNVGL